PRFAPDRQKLAWSCYDRKTGSALWMSDGEGNEPERLLKDRGAKNFTWRSDSKAFVFAATHIVNRFNTWSDIYMYNLESKKVVSLTGGARARDPDFSPDGSQLVMVTNKVQNNQLEVMTVDRQKRALTNITDHTQFSTPRYSPDGQVLAVSVWSSGRRDLYLYDTLGNPVRRLTADTATDRDPEWSANGQWLYFASDRSGIPNIYAINTQTEHLYQVTNVLTGAVKPAVNPDNTLLAYQQYSHDGWDVRILDLDPASFIDRGLLPASLTYSTPIRELTSIVNTPPASEPRAWNSLPPPDFRVSRLKTGLPSLGDPFPIIGQDPVETLDTFEQAKVKDVFGNEQDYPFTIKPKRYNPLATLLPRYVAPW
ncbi:MAG: hypothetical protein HN348_35760, partial [Proteobacteria bacterium]|nr:hypothetical protein [Pseudomonadota bacterium]